MEKYKKTYLSTKKIKIKREKRMKMKEKWGKF